MNLPDDLEARIASQANEDYIKGYIERAACSREDYINQFIRLPKARLAGYGPQEPWGVRLYKPDGLTEDQWRQRVAEKAEREWRDRVAQGVHTCERLQSPASDSWFAEIGGDRRGQHC